SKAEPLINNVRQKNLAGEIMVNAALLLRVNGNLGLIGRHYIQRQVAIGDYYKRPNSSLASSVMRSRSQGGVQTSLTRTSLTPGTVSAAFSTSPGVLCATGQAGVVSVISTNTTPPFLTTSS